MTEEAFDEIYRRQPEGGDVSRRRPLRNAQIAAGRGGRQVHLLSVRAQLGLRERGYSAYCSTKGGLVMLVKQHAMELAPHGITVNGVAPTVVRTALAGRGWTNPAIAGSSWSASRWDASPNPRTSSALRCSSARRRFGFVTGQILYVDGGITASQ